MELHTPVSLHPAFPHQTICPPRCALGENPVWCEKTGEFFWTDILGGSIYACNPSGKETRTVIRTEFQTGAFLFTKNWNLLIFAETGLYLSPPVSRQKELQQSELQLFAPLSFSPGERFNDAICDPYGFLLAGVKKNDDRGGRLLRFSPNGSSETVMTGLRISNGMGFSPDGTTFYHTDSGFGTITAYPYGSSGISGEGRCIYQSPDAARVPDGMTVAENGHLFFAEWGGFRIVELIPSGQAVKDYPLPAAQVSSVCFGGAAYRQLFATSAYIGEDAPASDSSSEKKTDFASLTETGDQVSAAGVSFLLSDVASGKPEYLPDLSPKL